MISWSNLSDVRKVIAGVLIVKILFCILIYNYFDYYPADDFYDKIASNLISGNGYVIKAGQSPNINRPPVYPFFLAFLFKLFGIWYLPVILFQILFDLITAGLIYYLGKSIFDQKTGLMASLGFVLYPFFSVYTVRILTETLFTCLLALVILSLYKAYLLNTKVSHFMAGIATGMGILCKTSLFYFPFFLLPVLIFYKKTGWINYLFFLLGTFLLILPWSCRNFTVTGHFLLLGTGGGYNLWLGNHLATEGRDNDELNPEEEIRLKKDITLITQSRGDIFTIENDKKFFKTALIQMYNNPGKTLILWCKKILRFWFDIFNKRYKIIGWVLIPAQTLLLLLALIGSYQAFYHKKELFLLLTVVLYFNLIHMITAATFRYSIPIMPYILADAGYSLQPWCIVPFLRHNRLTQVQKKFNKKLSSVRVTVERSIGIWKGRFRSMLYQSRLPWEHLPIVIHATLILHNMCIKYNDGVDEDWIDIVQDYERQRDERFRQFARRDALPQNEEAENNSGQDVRNALIRHLEYHNAL